MIIRGKIFKKRPYLNRENNTMDCIAFIELPNGLVVNGDLIKIIPVLMEKAEIKKAVGDEIEVDGEIEFERIVTMNGTKSVHPVPVVKLTQ